MYKWDEISIDSIIGGKSPDGVSNLKLFLIDYSKLFNEQNLNASCSSCIKEYHRKWINKQREMENKCKYRLKPKYENIQLQFGSNVIVNNGNITDEIALQLLAKRGDRIFSVMPQSPIIEQTPSAPKPKGRGRRKSK